MDLSTSPPKKRICKEEEKKKNDIELSLASLPNNMKSAIVAKCDFIEQAKFLKSSSHASEFFKKNIGAKIDLEFCFGQEIHVMDQIYKTIRINQLESFKNYRIRYIEINRSLHESEQIVVKEMLKKVWGNFRLACFSFEPPQSEPLREIIAMKPSSITWRLPTDYLFPNWDATTDSVPEKLWETIGIYKRFCLCRSVFPLKSFAYKLEQEWLNGADVGKNKIVIVIGTKNIIADRKKPKEMPIKGMLQVNHPEEMCMNAGYMIEDGGHNSAPPSSDDSDDNGDDLARQLAEYFPPGPPQESSSDSDSEDELKCCELHRRRSHSIPVDVYKLECEDGRCAAVVKNYGWEDICGVTYAFVPDWKDVGTFISFENQEEREKKERRQRRKRANKKLLK